jgi:uncharacterized protein YndB with AHSA1/START domain
MRPGGGITMPRLDFRWVATINAPVEQVFGCMRNPETIFRALAAGDPRVETTMIEVTPDGVGTTGRNVFPLPGLKRLGITGEVVNEIIEVVPDRRIVFKSTPSMGRLFRFEGTWTWTFEPENGATKLVVDYTEWANWLVYIFDRLTENQQTRRFGEAIAPWVESAVRARDVSRG